MLEKNKILKELMIIPGVGKSIAYDLYELGITSVKDLIGKNPEEMYEKFCEMKNQRIDRCLLYVFRCAVYFSENESHDSELLKWWNWK